MHTSVIIGLSAVIVTSDDDAPLVLSTRHSYEDMHDALPSGLFDPDHHRTFELAIRNWVHTQTGFELGYVEQLYTFGDQGREHLRAKAANQGEKARIISVGYLALTPEPTTIGAFDAVWRNWYKYFPWEDHRNGVPELLSLCIKPAILKWVASAKSHTEKDKRLDRARVAFGLEGCVWLEERVLERYELLYEAGLLYEVYHDRGKIYPSGNQTIPGKAMTSDHRRILATAIGRLRGKLKYRPIVFELVGEVFTLSALQKRVESILGQSLHKQNFRRALKKSGLVEGTGQMKTATGGRPAELFRFRREVLTDRAVSGVQTPIQKL